jgi:hypothetical protein
MRAFFIGENMNTNKQRQIRQDFLAREGLSVLDGPTLVLLAPVGSTVDTDDLIIGALSGDPTIAGNSTKEDIEVGFRKLNMDKTDKGIKPSITLPMMCLQPLGLKLAFDTDVYQLIQPTTPIASTVDTTTAPTRFTVTLDTTAGFLKGQTVAITTGTTNPSPEIKTVSDYNSTTKLLTFVQPLDRAPVDGADVFVVKTERLVIGGDIAKNYKVKLITIHDDFSESIIIVNRAVVSADGYLTGGMDGPKMAEIKLEALADVTEVNGNILTTYITFDKNHPVTSGELAGTA